MKALMPLLFFSYLIISFTSCNKDDNEQINFFNKEYRKGLWISPDKKDTLDFIDNSNLVRKGYYYSYEEYLYRIEGQTIFIKIPDASYETQHPILKIDNNSVVIGNMYITTGFYDNAGTFIKENDK